MANVARGSADPDTAGNALRQSIDNYAKGSQSGEYYDRFRSMLPENVGMTRFPASEAARKDIRQGRTLLRDKEGQALRETSELSPAPMSWVDPMAPMTGESPSPPISVRSFDDMKRLYSHLRSLIRTKPQNPAEAGWDRGELNQAAEALRKDMHTFIKAKGGPEAQRALDRADQFHRALAGRKEAVNPYIKAGSDEQTIARVYRVASDSSSRANIKELRSLRRAIQSSDSPEAWDDVAASVSREMGNKGGVPNLSKFATEWDKMDDKAKALLFNNKEHREALEHLAVLGRSRKEFESYANTSGTGRMMLPGMSVAFALGNVMAAAAGLVGTRSLALHWSKPATTKHLAKWTKQLEQSQRMMKKNPKGASRLAGAANRGLAAYMATEFEGNQNDIERMIENSTKSGGLTPLENDQVLSGDLL